MSQSRRQFIKNSAMMGATAAFSYSDLSRLMGAIMRHTINNAYAIETGITSKNYVNFQLTAAPPRWAFDQWLTPNPTDITLSVSNPTTWNTGVATNYSAGVPEYNTFPYKGLRIPITMDGSVYGPGNVLRPITNLLDHMAVIRGYNSQTDGHTVNQAIQNFPDPSVPSIAGAASDYRKDTISAVRANAGEFGYLSGMGKTITNLGASSNYLEEMMAPFKKYYSTKSILNNDAYFSEVKSHFSAVMKKMKSDTDPKTASILGDQTAAAQVLINMAKEDLLVVWETLFNKYKTIMNSSMNFTGNTAFGVDAALGSSPLYFTAADVTANFIPNPPIDETFDFRRSVQNPEIEINTELVRTFALAEFCLTRGITGVIAGGTNGGVVGNFLTEVSSGTAALMSLGADQHFVPFKYAHFQNIAFYRGLSAGLLELIHVLKSTPYGGATLFDNTVIHVTGDFGRSPRFDNSGSDHGWNAQVSSIFSSQVNGPLVVGNILSQYSVAGYPGCWGVAAPVDFNGSLETLSPRHVGAAVAHLLGVPNPWKFTHLVWGLRDGVIVPRIGAEIKS